MLETICHPKQSKSVENCCRHQFEILLTDVAVREPQVCCVAALPGLACFRSSGSKQKNCNSPGLKTWKFLMTGVQHPGRVWRLQRAAAPLREMSQCKHQDSQEETAPTSTVNWTVFYWLNWRLMALKNLLMLFINWTRKNTRPFSGSHVIFLF